MATKAQRLVLRLDAVVLGTDMGALDETHLRPGESMWYGMNQSVVLTSVVTIGILLSENYSTPRLS